jgi:16S rRNA (guanine966-N2)-methyltransferase
VVFLDPPFRQNFIEQTAVLLNEKSLADNALIYIEMESENNNQKLPLNWKLLKEKIAGQVIYRLYQKM